MFIRLYFTRLKCLFRNKESMFWSYMFPILLASCFFFAFNNLGKAENFQTIKIAYDNEGVQNDEFGSILSSAKLSDNTFMFDITSCGSEEAKKLLEEGKIEAYIVGSTQPRLYVKKNGLNETIMKSFLDSYRQMQVTVNTIIQKNPNAINEGLIGEIMNYDSFVKQPQNQKKPDNLLIYFYSLLAFTCVFAASWGLDEVVNIQADLSGCGARLNVSPVRKMKLFLCNTAAAFTAHIISIVLLFLYMYYVLKVNFGHNLGLLFLICFIGSLAGIALGATVGVWVKKKEVKGAILSVAVLGGGFLSGMMIADIKYLIAEKFPLLGYINPVNLVSDAMYSLYYYDTYNRFYLDTALLCIITVILIAASYLGIRRKSYASI